MDRYRHSIFDLVLNIGYVSRCGMGGVKRFKRYLGGGVCYLRGSLDSLGKWFSFLYSLGEYDRWLFVLDVGELDLRHYDLPYNVIYCMVDRRRLSGRGKFVGCFDYSKLGYLRDRGYKVGIINEVGGYIRYKGIDLLIVLTHNWVGFPLRSIRCSCPVVGDKGYGRCRDYIYSSHDILRIYD